MSDIADPYRIARRRAARRALLAEFWFYFSQNRGAVIGLAVFVLLVLSLAIFAPFLAPYAPDRASIATRLLAAAVWAGGRRSGISCSAPTRSAATCSRA